MTWLAEYPWFKVFNDMPMDPKIRRLEPALRWGWVCILSTASEARNWTENVGDLLIAENTPATIEDLADIAGLDVTLMSRLCHTLCHTGMLRIVTRENTGEVYHVGSFAKRNKRKPSEEPEAARDRKRRQRADPGHITPCGKCGMSHPMSHPCHADVTPPEDRGKSIDDRVPEKEEEEGVKPGPSEGAVSWRKWFEQKFAGKWPRNDHATVLDNAAKTGVDAQVIIDCLEMGVQERVRDPLSWAAAVVANMVAAGVRTVEDATEYRRRREARDKPEGEAQVRPKRNRSLEIIEEIERNRAAAQQEAKVNAQRNASDQP